MTVLTDHRKSVDIIRRRFLFSKRNILSLFAVILGRLIWVSGLSEHLKAA